MSSSCMAVVGHRPMIGDVRHVDCLTVFVFTKPDLLRGRVGITVAASIRDSWKVLLDTFDKRRDAALAISEPSRQIWGWGLTINQSSDSDQLIIDVIHSASNAGPLSVWILFRVASSTIPAMGIPICAMELSWPGASCTPHCASNPFIVKISAC